MEEAPPDLALLRVLAGRLIPADAEFDVPGADDAAIFAEIEVELRPNRSAMNELAGGLAQIDADQLAHAPLDRLLPQIQAMRPAAFPAFAVALIQAYYRDDRVMRSLNMEARPPFPKGYAIQDGDLSLLDPVRARGPIWRDAK